MTKILLGLLTTFLFIGCSSSAVEENVKPKLVVGKSIADLKLNDQFDKPHTLNADTYKLIFAFSKDSAHICNDFFVTKTPTYIEDHHAQFIADVSSAPSVIRSMFIMPGLKEFKHTVLLLDDKTVAAAFKKDMDIEKIVIVYILNKEITEIKTISTEEELRKTLEDDSPMSLIAPVINQVLN